MEGAESFATLFPPLLFPKDCTSQMGVKVFPPGGRLGLFAIAAQEKDSPGQRFGEGGKNASARWAVLRGTRVLDKLASFLGFAGTYGGFAGSDNAVAALDAGVSGEKLSTWVQVAFSATDGGLFGGMALRSAGTLGIARASTGLLS